MSHLGIQKTERRNEGTVKEREGRWRKDDSNEGKRKVRNGCKREIIKNGEKKREKEYMYEGRKERKGDRMTKIYVEKEERGKRTNNVGEEKD